MHSFTSCLVHCVWSTKNREPCLGSDLRERLWPYLGGIAKQNQTKTLAISGASDHVHLLLALPATISVAKAMQLLKGNSSKWIRETFPKMRAFAWQEGYGAFSVAVSGVDATVAYIQNQAEHHRTRSFREEYVAMLKSRKLSGLRTTKTCSPKAFFRPCRDSIYCESVYPALKRWAISDFVTSRKRLEIATIDFGVDLLQRRLVLPPWGEIFFKFVVPRELIAARDVRSQFGQLLWRQFINGLFDFGETHSATLVAARFVFNHR